VFDPVNDDIDHGPGLALFLVALAIPCFGICGNGTRIYRRTCNAPVGGGRICAGPTQREESCDLNRTCPSMPIDDVHAHSRQLLFVVCFSSWWLEHLVEFQ
jgi:hypothetical protein